ncbi:MAG: segregation/condensation protein A [Chloroflexi bacterium]|nr:segregation/condensation protein A [Chloroflexota bacterium]
MPSKALSNGRNEVATVDPPMAGQGGYQLKLPLFQGPLELLLELIQDKHLDITTISLVEVTDQYLEYIYSAETVDSEELSDFIVIAAKLLFLKSCHLLPHPPDLPGEEVGHGLVIQLSEYRRFRAAAQWLREREEKGGRCYPRLVPAPPITFVKPENVSLSDLARAFSQALQRHTPRSTRLLESEPLIITNLMEVIHRALLASSPVSFRSLMSRAASSKEIVILFLALLEMVKERRVQATQESLFGDIAITPAR